MANLEKSYSPKAVEDKNYKFWTEKGYFKGQIKEDMPSYSIVMPPPNITGQLHMGHALDNTFQDILIRYKRMQGFGTLWVPGTDHASIATEAKIVAAMKEEGLTKEDVTVFWSAHGIGADSTVHALLPNSKRWVLPAIGTESALPWMRAVPKPCARCLLTCIKKV